ncbi:MAG: cation:proton antiporter [Candidatus Heimdallarchaeota archaeon]|nr:cation:proton antiporter [Candidatus Heimdallarchaeota archaeon]MDH5647300.1 cation:proton antiporter [Candidatus Heimdallarchaeota archaeon]
MALTTDFELAFLLIATFLVLIKGSHVVMNKLKLPHVLGEVLLGFILGPTIIGVFYLKNGESSSIFTILPSVTNHQVGYAFYVISFLTEFAVLLLLFKVGTEIDFDVLKSVKIPSLYSAIGGILVPLLAGLMFFFTTLYFIPELIIKEGSKPIEVILFLAVSLTATSIGISTRIFLDVGKIKTKVAQTVVGAAIFDDIVSVTALGLSVAYVSGAIVFTLTGITVIFLEIGLFFLICFILFKYIIPRLIDRTKVIQDRSFTIFFSIGFMLFMAVLAQNLQLAPIIGAFMAGVIIGNEDDFLDVHKDYEPLADWIIPFFFISIGLKINVIEIITPTIALMGVTLAILVILAKFTGGSIGSRLSGKEWSNSRVVGLSMAAKGEVTLIFASTGYALGIFTPALYFSLILVVVLDSLLIPTLLKFAINRWMVEEIDIENTNQTHIEDNNLVNQFNSVPV